MGLDAYILTRNRFPENTTSKNIEQKIEQLGDDSQPTELAYYRKFNALHGWMEDRWREQTYEQFLERADITVTLEEWMDYKADSFNQIPYFMNAEDIDRLIAAIDAKALKGRQGFFFGDASDEHTVNRLEAEKPELLKTLLEAKEHLKQNRVVYYDSWW